MVRDGKVENRKFFFFFNFPSCIWLGVRKRRDEHVRDILDILVQCNKLKLTPVCTSSLRFSCLYILMLEFIVTQVIVLHSYTIKM